jgi:hypothetical protein
MRPRFSIRALLILTTLVAAACGWWVAAPTIVAHRFSRAIKSQDYAAADALCARPEDAFISDLAAELSLQAAKHLPPPRGSLTLDPRNWHDIVRREQRMTLHFPVTRMQTDGIMTNRTGQQLAQTSPVIIQNDFFLIATPAGIIPAD